ncbi:MAG: glycosyltransferase family 2 protein [Parcubacteria group bacterium]|nr:glycosyltransferase family 2 protein [Parcubacteria group bacterium]
MLSVIIPSRSDAYLQKTVDDVLNKAKGEVEVVVVLDGYWPGTMVRDDKRVIVIHHGELRSNFGLRTSVNRGVLVSRGKYIMKIDDHVALDEGFDVKLAADCKDDWVVVPRLYALKDEGWTKDNAGRAPFDAGYVTYPLKDGTLSGKPWSGWLESRKEILIDDCMLSAGACYFMKREHWNKLGLLDEKNYGAFPSFENLEVCLKTWLGGGRVVTNKKTWCAHRWGERGPKHKGWDYSNEQVRKIHENRRAAINYTNDFWLNNKWPDRIYDFDWLIDKFWPVPDWPENWKEEIRKWSQQP